MRTKTTRKMSSCCDGRDLRGGHAKRKWSFKEVPPHIQTRGGSSASKRWTICKIENRRLINWRKIQTSSYQTSLAKMGPENWNLVVQFFKQKNRGGSSFLMQNKASCFNLFFLAKLGKFKFKKPADVTRHSKVRPKSAFLVAPHWDRVKKGGEIGTKEDGEKIGDAKSSWVTDGFSFLIILKNAFLTLHN